VKKIALSWDECLGYSQALAGLIKGRTGAPYDLIVSIARGGWIPARLIAKHLNIRELVSYGVRSYNDEDEQEKVVVYQDFPKNIDTLVRDRHVLIVDDIADTGKTLRTAYDILLKLHPKTLATACTHFKKRSTIEPKFYIHEVEDTTWIEFPWE